MSPDYLRVTVMIGGLVVAYVSIDARRCSEAASAPASGE